MPDILYFIEIQSPYHKQTVYICQFLWHQALLIWSEPEILKHSSWLNALTVICINQPGKFTCDCNDTGYEGDLCGIDIDECTADQPCENGVFCTNQTGSFVCKSKYMQYFTKNILSCTSGITKEFLSRDY